MPDGAYQLTLRTVDIDGREQTETRFFVRSSALPPVGESQHYFEAGGINQVSDRTIQRSDASGAWARLGSARRFTDRLALEGELLHARRTQYATGGAYWFARNWQLHFSLLHSSSGDTGYAMRGSMTRGRLALSFDYRQVDHANPLTEPVGVLNGSFKQGHSTLSFPLFKGQGFVRARLNERQDEEVDKGIGFSYLGPLFKRGPIAAELSFDSNLGNQQSWFRLGVTLRTRHGNHYSSTTPQWQFSDTSDGERRSEPSLDARWTHTRHNTRFGDLQQSAYALHNPQRSVLGTRMTSQSRYGFADLDLAHESGDAHRGLNYSANSRFSLVTKNGRTAMGGGAHNLSAVLVEIDGFLPQTRFQVLVDGRVAGYVDSSHRAIVSLRPYEQYRISIAPVGDALYNYDQQAQTVTLYPGNVPRLTFAAHRIQVLVGRALFADGTPVANGRLSTTESHGATDAQGWFQVEIKDLAPIRVQYAPDKFCALTLTDAAANHADQTLLIRMRHSWCSALIGQQGCLRLRVLQLLLLTHPLIELGLEFVLQGAGTVAIGLLFNFVHRLRGFGGFQLRPGLT